MHRNALLWVLVLLVGTAATAGAQVSHEIEEDVVTEEPFEPGLEGSAWEIQFIMGSLGLDKRLFGAKSILVDAENPDDLIFADMEIVGQTSFSPQIRLARTFGHIVFENTAGFAVGDYLQSVTTGSERKVPLDSKNVLTENEIAKGSYFVFYHDHALSYYPWNRGRIMPFLTVGVGTQRYSIDSNYLDGDPSSVAVSYGGGIRVVGDDLFSFRLEVRAYNLSVDYTAERNFRKQVPSPDNSGLVNIPLQVLDANGIPQPVVDASGNFTNPFGAESYTNIWFGVGVTASF